MDVDDEESFESGYSSGPAPPPPDHPHPEDASGVVMGNDEYGDNYDQHRYDEYSRDEEELQKNYDDGSGDPPAEVTAEDEDWEEDQSVEIPPTTVVQRMVAHEQAGKGGRFKFLALGLLCCVLILAVVLGAGFGTGAFTKSSSNDRSAPTVDPGTQPPPQEENPVFEAGRPQEMASFIASSSVTGEAALETNNSPEVLSINWLIEEDPLQLDPTAEADKPRILQRYALLTLYFGSELDWVNENGWATAETSNECEWEGITCELQGDLNVVTEINLPQNNVQGTIPADLAMLGSLVTLNLSSNVMTGPIPASILQMNSLEEIFLFRNNLEQDLSEVDFSGLVALRNLDLANNAFSGTIPTSFYSMTALQILVLDGNAFTGSISEEIGNLQSLGTFFAFINNLLYFRRLPLLISPFHGWSEPTHWKHSG